MKITTLLVTYAIACVAAGAICGAAYADAPPELQTRIAWTFGLGIVSGFFVIGRAIYRRWKG